MRILRQGWLTALLLLICLIAERANLASEPIPPTTTTTLNQLIEANQQSRQQLRNVCMEYDLEGTLVKEDKSRVVSQSQGHIFCAADNYHRLRLKLVNLDGQRTTTDRYFADGLMHEQTYNQTFDPVARPISPKS